jgi:hypothetical protein
MVLVALLLVMATVINVTMIAAVMQLFGNVPDGPFLKIISRHLRRKSEEKDVLLSPGDATERLGAIHRGIIRICVAIVVAATAMSIWALAVGWGPFAMAAITLWVIAGNLFFSSIAPANWGRRARRIKPAVYEEDWGDRPPENNQG